MENLLSSEDIDQIYAEYERKKRLAVAMAQLRAQAKAVPPMPKGVPDFPPEPDFWKSLAITWQYLAEGPKHLGDDTLIVKGLIRLFGTEDGLKLIGRLKDALVNKKDDPTLFRDFMQALGGGKEGYGSFLIGVASEAHLGAGVIGTTGVAIPVRGEGKVKWFSGLERSKGFILELTANLIVGQRTEEPQHLTGQFYGQHVALDIGVAFGSNLYFDTSDKLNYKGFSTNVGVGAGGGEAVLWGWELVTSD
ncbi:MAG TPA: hypothetical protein VKE51_20910 [Vicinamibacterales bacterium]|nr:hypothetical protein [Vicinamibacterales bacterium]